MFKSKPHYVEFLEGLFVGGSLAAVAVFVLGTGKGKRLQKQLLERYKKLGRKAGHYAHNVQRAVKSPVAKKLKRMVKKAASRKTARKTVRTARRKHAARKAR
jgi:hypothetical protein